VQPLEPHGFVRFNVGAKHGEALSRNRGRDMVRAVARP